MVLSEPVISKRITCIYNQFYRKVAEDKYVDLFKELDVFSDSTILDNNYVHHIEEHKLRALVKSYYIDVIRYKEYHFNPKEDVRRGIKPLDIFSKEWAEKIHTEKVIAENKAAALTLKWLIKYLPVDFLVDSTVSGFEPSEDEKKILLGANAMFAINHCLELMDISPEKVSLQVYEDILYHLLYRNFDETYFDIIFGQMLEYCR